MIGEPSRLSACILILQPITTPMKTVQPAKIAFALIAFYLLPALPADAQVSDFEGAVFYQHADYRGSQISLYPGEGMPYLTDYALNYRNSWNDQISSVAVWGPVDVFLYEHVRYEGDVLQLSDHAWSLGNWNDRASSLFVDYAVQDGWVYDYTLQSWVFEDGDWIYHESGLGWIYERWFDPTAGEGWLWDEQRGWIFTTIDNYPWFYAESGEMLFFEHGTRNPRIWYSESFGWFVD